MNECVRKQANYGMSIRNTNVNHVRETHNEKSRRNFILTDCIILYYNISRRISYFLAKDLTIPNPKITMKNVL